MSDQQTNQGDRWWSLAPEEELLLHQLQARKYWAGAQSADEGGRVGADEQTPLAEAPTAWSLTGGLALYPWQAECIERWFAAEGRGTVKVVTGAGKTLMALALAERLQNEREPELRVAVVVPTIVLMEQWRSEILRHGNLSASHIGRMGGGYRDDFGDSCRILLCVINSARERLPDLVRQAGVDDRLLLIVDECHRAGADMMQRVFQTPRRYNLGLSATPEREEDADPEEDAEGEQPAAEEAADYASTLLGLELGDIIYSMSLQDAFDMGILPSYEIRHYGLSLTPAEAQRYEQSSRTIQELRDVLWSAAAERGVRSVGQFSRWCRSRMARGGEAAPEAARYVGEVARRKSLLYRATARRQAVRELVRQELELNPQARIILFHESIREAMELWAELVREGFPAAPENSQLTDGLRETSIELFRRGVAQVLVSVRSLVEGFNVPAADVGIIVASSTSVRQRIQTCGRVLRKHRTHDGEEKHAVIHTLYLAGTVDERIYEKMDWSRITGAERNLYLLWEPGRDPVQQPGPPRQPLPGDRQISPESLSEGAEYPARYEGAEYVADSQGNIYVEGDRGRPVANPQGLPARILEAKGSYGRFRVTPTQGFVLVRVPQEDTWMTVYVTALAAPFREAVPCEPGAPVDLEQLQPGDPYPYPPEAGAEELLHKQRRGERVIARRVKRGELYARPSGRAADSERGRQADELLDALAQAENHLGARIPRFHLTGDGLALVQRAGQWFFIAKCRTSLEFPV